MMARLSAVLLVALMLSASYLVRVQYDSRRLFAELSKAASEAQRLETERDWLETEKRIAVSSLRVEALARARLSMRPVTIADTEYVEYVTPQENKR